MFTIDNKCKILKCILVVMYVNDFQLKKDIFKNMDLIH
jgi:hypothetical protein